MMRSTSRYACDGDFRFEKVPAGPHDDLVFLVPKRFLTVGYVAIVYAGEGGPKLHTTVLCFSPQRVVVRSPELRQYLCKLQRDHQVTATLVVVVRSFVTVHVRSECTVLVGAGATSLTPGSSPHTSHRGQYVRHSASECRFRSGNEDYLAFAAGASGSEQAAAAPIRRDAAAFDPMPRGRLCPVACTEAATEDASWAVRKPMGSWAVSGWASALACACTLSVPDATVARDVLVSTMTSTSEAVLTGSGELDLHTVRSNHAARKALANALTDVAAARQWTFTDVALPIETSVHDLHTDGVDFSADKNGFLASRLVLLVPRHAPFEMQGMNEDAEWDVAATELAAMQSHAVAVSDDDDDDNDDVDDNSGSAAATDYLAFGVTGQRSARNRLDLQLRQLRDDGRGVVKVALTLDMSCNFRGVLPVIRVDVS